VKHLNRETAIRLEMTPDVLDDIGSQLVRSALDYGCGARFTGAGGGGCIWALGNEDKISELKTAWDKILCQRKEACLLDIDIDKNGLLTDPV